MWKFGNKKYGKRAWDVDRLFVSFFVTKFPKNVRSICEKHEFVSDVYMVNKLLKLGRRFAFVRFLRVYGEWALELKFRTEWRGSFHLFELWEGSQG